MSKDDVGNKIYNLIKQKVHPSHPSTDGSNIAIRCPYCGDSKKSTDSTHFYIYLTPPYGCHCFKCQAHIYSFNSELMKDLNIYDVNLSNEMALIQKDYKYNSEKSKTHLNFNTNNLYIPKYRGAKNELIKLNYLNNRLGTNINIDDCNKFKIIINFKEFLKINNIDEYTEKESMIDVLYKYCIGFLSYDNNYIIFRSLDERLTNFRYHNYRINPNFEGTKKFYIIRNNVDILSEKLNVIITEGIMDILGVYHHLYKNNYDENKNNYLFISCNGKSYNLLFRHLARLGFLEQNISIYSDSDVNLNFYKSLKRKNILLKYSNFSVYYNDIYNSKGKSDFGVSKDKIKLRLASKF